MEDINATSQWQIISQSENQKTPHQTKDMQQKKIQEVVQPIMMRQNNVMKQPMEEDNTVKRKMDQDNDYKVQNKISRDGLCVEPLFNKKLELPLTMHEETQSPEQPGQMGLEQILLAIKKGMAQNLEQAKPEATKPDQSGSSRTTSNEMSTEEIDEIIEPILQEVEVDKERRDMMRDMVKANIMKLTLSKIRSLRKELSDYNLEIKIYHNNNFERREVHEARGNMQGIMLREISQRQEEGLKIGDKEECKKCYSYVTSQHMKAHLKSGKCRSIKDDEKLKKEYMKLKF